MSIETLVNEFSAIAANPHGQLKAYKEKGMKCIGVMPYYAPEELVYAAGMMPMGMWGSNKKTIAQEKQVNLFKLIVEVSAIDQKSPSEELIAKVADTLK